ncbi:MAG: double-strand break repair helicase AddA [Cohaesibacteraceae bacterium]|nr:double-strand break repair helicase AddA [Cohaesibacteraceae bacterium]
MRVPLDTLERQKRALNPVASVWVSANAGSGKTYVLSRRVIRLLLAGSAPSKILCLTFTKAAAAEMANRVFDELGRWATIEDIVLDAEIEALEGSKPSKEKRIRARQLFANALETPGGLKIQTIHAFAERLLHQFPFEANTPAHFELMDDHLTTELMATAERRLLSGLQNDPDDQLKQALDLLVERISDGGIRDALKYILFRRSDFRDAARSCSSRNDPDNFSAIADKLAGIFGLESDKAGVLECFSGTFDKETARRIVEDMYEGGKRDQKHAALLMAATHVDIQHNYLDILSKSVLTSKLEPMKSMYFASRKIHNKWPELEPWLSDFQQRLIEQIEKQKRRDTLALTRALLLLAEKMNLVFQKLKRDRSLIDFDDLIVRAAELLSQSDAAAWVHYKLDQGVDHILVDEAQDTNPRQWEIVEKLASEFFTGASARLVDRTIFAVGDEKQSIYSFQGAEPRKFAEMRRHFAKKTEQAAQQWDSVNLMLSFRSTPAVLSAVDRVFQAPQNYHALGEEAEPTIHEAIRITDPGRVEIWPLFEPSEIPEIEDWDTPLDHMSQASPPAALAKHIAATVSFWIDNKVILEGKGRPVIPGDILVLVRKRAGFVPAMNRAFKAAGIPVAGEDRLALGDHIAVEDLLALADCMLLPEDDMSLAIVLKSPLIGLSEEQLYRIAIDRKGVLDSALRRHAASADDPDITVALQRLDNWRRQADFLTPFEFFSNVLMRDGSRARFFARMGNQVLDILAEFLNQALAYERVDTPTLQGFLGWMRARKVDIKRDADLTTNEVQVMTVHGAKGLEKPIVFLVDSTSAPLSAQHDPDFVLLADGDTEAAGIPAWVVPKSIRPTILDNAIERHREQGRAEYLRLLYVAMTRSADRLISCGYRNGSRPADEDCWYSVIRNALWDAATGEPDPVSGTEIKVWYGPQTTKPVEFDPSSSGIESGMQSLPDWIDRPVETTFPRPRQIIPSRVDGLIVGRAAENLFEIVSPTLDIDPVKKGLLLHRLFEMIPGLPLDLRRQTAMDYVTTKEPGFTSIQRAALVKECFSVLEDPEFAPVFASGSLAEASLSGVLETSANPIEISGQVDRVFLSDTSIILVDFKTNRHIPRSARDIPPAYVTQLALYRYLVEKIFPDVTVKTALLWTAVPRFMPIEAVLLDQSLDKLTSDSGSNQKAVP